MYSRPLATLAVSGETRVTFMALSLAELAKTRAPVSRAMLEPPVKNPWRVVVRERWGEFLAGAVMYSRMASGLDALFPARSVAVTAKVM